MAGSAPSPACKAYNWRKPFEEGTWTVRRLRRNSRSVTLVLVREELSPLGRAIVMPRSYSHKIRRGFGTNATLKFKRWWKGLAATNLVRMCRRAASRRRRTRALLVLRSLPREIVELVVRLL